MSTFEPVRLSLTEISRYGQSLFMAAGRPRTLIFITEAALREDVLDRLAQAIEGLPIVLDRTDPAQMMADERKRAFIQGVFNRDARGSGADPVQAFVTSDAEFLHRINAIPAIERSAFYDLRTHMA